MTVTDQKLKDGTAPVKESRVFSLAVTGLMAAVICVLGPLSIPLPGDLVPVSLGTLGVFLASVILGWKKGLIAVLIYLLIGFVGLPVFAGFTAGAGKLFGPTGGYLIGYIPTVLIAGFFADRFRGKKLMMLLGIILGTAVLYVFGSLWLSWQAKMSIGAAFMAGCVPFIPADLVKAFIAVFLGDAISRAIRK